MRQTLLTTEIFSQAAASILAAEPGAKLTETRLRYSLKSWGCGGVSWAVLKRVWSEWDHARSAAAESENQADATAVLDSAVHRTGVFADPNFNHHWNALITRAEDVVAGRFAARTSRLDAKESELAMRERALDQRSVGFEHALVDLRLQIENQAVELRELRSERIELAVTIATLNEQLESARAKLKEGADAIRIGAGELAMLETRLTQVLQRALASASTSMQR